MANLRNGDKPDKNMSVLEQIETGASAAQRAAPSLPDTVEKTLSSSLILHYNHGFSNAIRRNIRMRHLIFWFLFFIAVILWILAFSAMGWPISLSFFKSLIFSVVKKLWNWTAAVVGDAQKSKHFWWLRTANSCGGSFGVEPIRFL